MKRTDQLPVLGTSYLMPHPPVILGEVGKGREEEASATREFCAEAAREIAREKPETLVIFSPHAPLFSDYIYVYDGPILSGSFGTFGAPELIMRFEQDTELRTLLVDMMKSEGFHCGSLDEKMSVTDRTLDHGVLVPLYFIRQAYPGFKIVALSSPVYTSDELRALGMIVRKAAKKSGRRISIIASGDMSHKVTEMSPYGKVEEGAVFDTAVCDSLRASDISSLLSIDSVLREKAAECGYGSLTILCGAFHAVPVQTRLIGYEAPFGIGYCVASFAEIRSDLRVRIAEHTIETYLNTGLVVQVRDLEKICLDASDFSTLELLRSERSGVFVSMKKKGELRGCIGTTSSTRDNLAEEIIQNALSAALEDPRFEPVQTDELDSIDLSVDVLGKAVSVKTRAELDPSKWGVIVTYQGRRGLLLPDLEGVETVDVQLSIACKKAGIDPLSPFEIQKFAVTRYR